MKTIRVWVDQSQTTTNIEINKITAYLLTKANQIPLVSATQVSHCEYQIKTKTVLVMIHQTNQKD